MVGNEKQDNVAEEKNTEHGYQAKDPTVKANESHSKSKKVIDQTDMKETSEEIITPIKTKQNELGKINSQFIGGDMTESKASNQFQTNSKNMNDMSVSKIEGKIQSQQDYSGKSVSSKSSSYRKSHSKSHQQSSRVHHKKSMVKHHQSASSSSVVKHGVKIPPYPFSDAVRGTKGSVR